MSIHQSTLEVRITRALSLRFHRYVADPAHPYSSAYWTGSLYHGAGRKTKHIVFAQTVERPPRTDFNEIYPDVVSIWVGNTSFEAPIDQRSRIEGWIAENADATASTPVGVRDGN